MGFFSTVVGCMTSLFSGSWQYEKVAGLAEYGAKFWQYDGIWQNMVVESRMASLQNFPKIKRVFEIAK